MAADGLFQDEEYAFAQQLARKWGYNSDKIEPFFQMAKSGQLRIRMPQDPEKIVKIYKLMEKAARADAHITDEERQVLEHVKLQYGIT